MTKIEHKRPGAKNAQDVFHRIPHSLAARNEQQWIEIALHRPYCLQCLMGNRQWHH